MKGLMIIMFVLVAVAGLEVWFINRDMNKKITLDMAQSCPVWLMDSPQEGCK